MRKGFDRLARMAYMFVAMNFAAAVALVHAARGRQVWR